MGKRKTGPGWGSFKYKIVELRESEPELSYREIATRLGCSYEYVKWVSQKCGFPTRQAYAPIKDRYFELRKQHPDWSAHRIAQEMGINSGSAYKLMARCDDEYVTVFTLGKAARAAGLTLDDIRGMAHGRAA